MAYSNYGTISQNKEYARVLPGTDAGFRGVDFTANPSQVANHRFSALRNMWRDYHAENGGAVETVPGYRCLKEFDKNIHGVFHIRATDGTDVYAVHAGGALYVSSDPNDADGWLPLAGELADAKSCAFSYNGTLYLLDGTHYLKVEIETDGGAVAGGSVATVSDGATVPLAFVNGEVQEPYNLLTDAVRERAARSCADAVAPVYTDTDYSKVYRGRDTFCVPGYNADVYPTFRFDAFQAARTVVVDTDAICPSEGERVLQVGASSAATEAAAFCLRRETDVVELGDLRGMSALSALYLSTDAPKSQTGGYFGFAQQENETYFAPNVTTVHYSVTERNFEQLFVSVRDALRYLPPNVVVTRGETVKTDISFRFEDGWDTALLTVSAGVKLCAACEEREDVLQLYPEEGKLCLYCGKNIAVGRQYAYGRIREGREDMVSYLAPLRVQVMETAGECLPCTDVFDYPVEVLLFRPTVETDGVISVTDGACGMIYDGDAVGVGVLTRKGDGDVEMTLHTENNTRDGICGCTLCEVFDGRVFLAGNPALPHTVFTSEPNDPSWFGASNVLSDDTVRGLLVTGNALAVLGERGVRLRRGEGYPVVATLGIGALGPACNFLDDPVFLSPRGVEGILKDDTVVHRSLFVDGKLLSERELEKASMAVWDGYLCLFVGGNVYLADSRARTSDGQYEWFFLSDVGDGTPYPLGVGERLFFAAGNKLFTFNNDLRGVAYTHPNGDVEPVRADRIHPKHYTFDGRRIVCTAITKSDDCDIPHLAKSTVKKSLLLRLKTFDGSAVRLCVWTDRESSFRDFGVITNNGENFYADTFEHMGLVTAEDNIVSVRGHKKRWVEKRIMLSDGGVCQPFGIYGIAYRYTVQ